VPIVVGVDVVPDSPLGDGCVVVLQEGVVRTSGVVPIPNLKDVFLVRPLWVDAFGFDVPAEVFF
jgi:hypothetical protein